MSYRAVKTWAAAWLPRACFRLAGVGWLLLAAGCATGNKKQAAAPLAPPKPYLRVERAPDTTIALQVAARRLQGPRRHSPTLWLVGVSHIGESNYYATVQRQLDDCSLVLFEGVGGRPEKAPPTEPGESGELGSLQGRLARALGLVFQLDAIDYDRTHFKNSDVKLERLFELMQGGDQAQRGPDSEIRNLMAENAGPQGVQPGDPRQGMFDSGTMVPMVCLPESPEGQTNSANQGLDDLVGIMNGTSFLGALAHTLVEMIAASPRLQATVKVVLIETMGSLEGDLAQAKGLPGDIRELMDVLIRERNQVVLADVRAALSQKQPPGSIAIFYGAGHMHDLEQRLCADLGYRPVADQWLTAFSLNTRTAGLSDLELNMVRNLVKWQMEQLQKGR